MPRPSAVLETNILVSAHLRAEGLERIVLDLALSRRIQLFYSAAVFKEYEEVLKRPRFHIDPAKLAESLRLIRAAGKRVVPRRQLSAALDPDDNIFIECAEAAGARYLVTGNKRHFPDVWGPTRIVNARELLSAIFDEIKK
jgi:putative PIN family toxin of toxin-antitoxin system